MGAAGRFQQGFLRRAAVGVNDIQQRLRTGDLHGRKIGRRFVDPGTGAADRLCSKPQARRQDRAHSVVNRAEIAVAHPQGQAEPRLVQHRHWVQHGDHGFQTLPLFSVADFQHDPLCGAVSPPKGDEDPHAAVQQRPEGRRHFIGIGLIDPISRRGDCDPR